MLDGAGHVLARQVLSAAGRGVPHASPSRISLPRTNPDETRSYRFFVDVATPALAGLFDYGFWLDDVPRIALFDSAVWHAAVSLGAAFEIYRQPRVEPGDPLKILAMRQYSRSVSSLLGHKLRPDETWKALVISVLFTVLCNVQGMHTEANMHLQSGRRLLCQIQEMSDLTARPVPTASQDPGPKVDSQRLPISMEPITAMMANLELQASAGEHGGLHASRETVANCSLFNHWRYYQASNLVSLQVQRIQPQTRRRKFREELIRANQSALSLANALTYHRQETAQVTRDAIQANSRTNRSSDEGVEDLERPFVRCFKELRKASLIFEDLRHQGTFAIDGAECRAVDGLALQLASSRFMFYQDPEPGEEINEMDDMQARHEHMVHLADKILRATPAQGDAQLPVPIVLGPLLSVVHGAPSQGERRRAVALMRRYPQRDGLLDSRMQAEVWDVILEREQEIVRGDGADRSQGTGASLADDLHVPRPHRVCNMTSKHMGNRTLSITWRTWQESIDGEPGATRIIGGS